METNVGVSSTSNPKPQGQNVRLHNCLFPILVLIILSNRPKLNFVKESKMSFLRTRCPYSVGRNNRGHMEGHFSAMTNRQRIKPRSVSLPVLLVSFHPYQGPCLFCLLLFCSFRSLLLLSPPPFPSLPFPPIWHALLLKNVKILSLARITWMQNTITS